MSTHIICPTERSLWVFDWNPVPMRIQCISGLVHWTSGVCSALVGTDICDVSKGSAYGCKLWPRVRHHAHNHERKPFIYPGSWWKIAHKANNPGHTLQP